MTPTAQRVLLILVAALIALLAAVAATWLRASTGAPMQQAVLTGGATFGGTLTLVIVVLNSAGALP